MDVVFAGCFQGECVLKGTCAKIVLTTQFGLLRPEAVQDLPITDAIDLFFNIGTMFVRSLDQKSLEEAIAEFDHRRLSLEDIKARCSNRNAYFAQLLDSLVDLVTISLGRMREHKNWVEEDSKYSFGQDDRFRDRDFVPSDIIEFLVAAYPVFWAFADLLPNKGREERRSGLDEFQVRIIRNYRKQVGDFSLPDYSFLSTPAGRNAKEKQEFRGLVQELKRLAFEHRYTRNDLATELGVSIPTINQWWFGYAQLPKPMHIERLRKFLSAYRSG